MKAAILMTCFNRKEKTISCLETIYAQTNLAGLEFEIYLVDDASTDGTSEAVAKAFPEVFILQGNGALYWNGGMNMAWRAAEKDGFDCYLLINDDVALFSDALSVMFDAFLEGYGQCGQPPLIVGSFRETDSNAHAYGGFRIKRTIWAIKSRRILPNGGICRCDTFNGNLVLIPDEAVKSIGLLDQHYTHAFGDKDYGYRCMARSIPMYIAPNYVGRCARNRGEGAWFDPNATIAQRYHRLIQPTGLPPAEYFYAIRKNCSWLAGVIAIVKLYLRLLFPGVWLKLSRSQSGE